MVWVRHDDPFSYTGWADLQGRSGGTLVNNSYGQQFDDYANAHLKLEAVPSADQAFRKLLFKRNDYVIYELYPGLALARTLGISQQVQALAPPVSSEGLYLTLSHHSACNQPELRAQLAQNSPTCSTVPCLGNCWSKTSSAGRTSRLGRVRRASLDGGLT